VSAADRLHARLDAEQDPGVIEHRARLRAAADAMIREPDGGLQPDDDPQTFGEAETPDGGADVHALDAANANGTTPSTDLTVEILRAQDEAVKVQTDLANATAFAAEHAGLLRHVRERRMWLAFDGVRWRRDATGDAERAAKATARALLDRAVKVEDEDMRKKAVRWALTSQSERGLRAMLTVAATEPGLALGAEALDSDPWLLACSNGTVDLRTGTLRPHDPADLITMATEIAHDAKALCPRWLQFMREVFAEDAELIEFVRRFIGYCLTGDTREHVLVVLHGSGRNGKSTLVKILQKLLGEHAVTAELSTFLRARGDRGPRNDLARLHRARLVTAAESGEGRHLDESTVKEITGGDRLAARFLYGEHFEFTPHFKLAVVTNFKPKVSGEDDAIWARLRLVPFDVCFEGREDKTLDAKLEAEVPGILTWAVCGCLDWQREGLGTAAAVTSATAAYRQDEDVLGAFLAERCLMDGEIGPAELRLAYDAYCNEIGEKPLAANVLGKKLARRGIERHKRAGVYRGVSLRTANSEGEE
jgi:putative DNA primase/helicase